MTRVEKVEVKDVRLEATREARAKVGLGWRGWRKDVKLPEQLQRAMAAEAEGGQSQVGSGSSKLEWSV